MKRLRILQAMAALSAVLAPAAQAAPECTAYAQELATMVEAADAVRSRVDYLAPPGDAQAARHLAQLALVERDNGARLGALMAACGWLSAGRPGRRRGTPPADRLADAGGPSTQHRRDDHGRLPGTRRRQPRRQILKHTIYIV